MCDLIWFTFCFIAAVNNTAHSNPLTNYTGTLFDLQYSTSKRYQNPLSWWKQMQIKAIKIERIDKWIEAHQNQYQGHWTVHLPLGLFYHYLLPYLGIEWYPLS